VARAVGHHGEAHEREEPLIGAAPADRENGRDGERDQQRGNTCNSVHVDMLREGANRHVGERAERAALAERVDPPQPWLQSILCELYRNQDAEGQSGRDDQPPPTSARHFDQGRGNGEVGLERHQCDRCAAETRTYEQEAKAHEASEEETGLPEAKRAPRRGEVEEIARAEQVAERSFEPLVLRQDQDAPEEGEAADEAHDEGRRAHRPHLSDPGRRVEQV
jgi:hypothetical protein